MDQHDHSSDPIGDLEDLLSPFRAAITPRAQFRVGTEAEKFGLLSDSLEPLPYEGPRSVLAVLAALVADHGWSEYREYDAGALISLKREATSVTLEPAGQLELSGSPFATVHEACAEFSAHLEELRRVSEPLGVVWLSLGFHPFARDADLPRVPKLRYGIMERYMPTRGPRSADMMRRTCTVQANLDYESEDEAMRKLRVALALQPVATAAFANSPLYEGRVGQYLSERAAVWLQMDVDRSGILPFAWQKDQSLRSYVEWALDVPMFLVKRGARIIENTGQSFRSFLRDGASGARATFEDWETHLNSLFPEARLKKTLEVRGADAQPSDLVCAVPALWKGLLYDPTALAQAESLIRDLDATTVEQSRPEIARRALQARLLEHPLLWWAEQMVDIARGGLERLGHRNAAGRDESIHLAPLERRLERGITPAEELLAAIKADGGGSSALPAAIVAHARV
ncbi:MAG: glutamate-cysteine ligase family protein [Myxococcales bacterium]|nr:glutamate-cysteine ligase family protein [Myxococcales bacterium]